MPASTFDPDSIVNPRGSRYLRQRGVATVKRLIEVRSTLVRSVTFGGYPVWYVAPRWAARIWNRLNGRGSLLNYAIRRGITDPAFCQALEAVMDAYGWSEPGVISFLRAQRPLAVPAKVPTLEEIEQMWLRES